MAKAEVVTVVEMHNNGIGGDSGEGGSGVSDGGKGGVGHALQHYAFWSRTCYRTLAYVVRSGALRCVAVSAMSYVMRFITEYARCDIATLLRHRNRLQRLMLHACNTRRNRNQVI